MFGQLSVQRLKREKANKVVVANMLINAYYLNGRYQDVQTVYADAQPELKDLANTIMSTDMSAANSAFAQKQWDASKRGYEKVQAMAIVVGDYELQIKSYLNIANAAYWLDLDTVSKSVAGLTDGLLAIDLYDLGTKDKAYLRASLLNAKGLALKNTARWREVGRTRRSRIGIRGRHRSGRARSGDIRRRPASLRRLSGEQGRSVARREEI